MKNQSAYCPLPAAYFLFLSVCICAPSVAKKCIFLLRDLRVLYVQKTSKTFYYLPPCPRGEERSDEPCGHGDRPTTDRVSAHCGRRRAGSKPVPCIVSRT